MWSERRRKASEDGPGKPRVFLRTPRPVLALLSWRLNSTLGERTWYERSLLSPFHIFRRASVTRAQSPRRASSNPPQAWPADGGEAAGRTRRAPRTQANHGSTHRESKRPKQQTLQTLQSLQTLRPDLSFRPIVRQPPAAVAPPRTHGNRGKSAAGWTTEVRSGRRPNTPRNQSASVLVV